MVVLQCPTTIVPFFGDQPFWGDRVHARGVGPPPIPVDEFSLPKLIDAIKFMLDPKVFCFPIQYCRLAVLGIIFRLFPSILSPKEEKNAFLLSIALSPETTICLPTLEAEHFFFDIN